MLASSEQRCSDQSEAHTATFKLLEGNALTGCGRVLVCAPKWAIRKNFWRAAPAVVTEGRDLLYTRNEWDSTWVTAPEPVIAALSWLAWRPVLQRTRVRFPPRVILPNSQSISCQLSGCGVNKALHISEWFKKRNHPSDMSTSEMKLILKTFIQGSCSMNVCISN